MARTELRTFFSGEAPELPYIVDLVTDLVPSTMCYPDKLPSRFAAPHRIESGLFMRSRAVSPIRRFRRFRRFDLDPPGTVSLPSPNEPLAELDCR
jgi:hypothetical protein